MPAMPVVYELTLEVPLSREPETRFLTRLLKPVKTIQFARLDSRGFLFVCRVMRGDLPDFKENLKPKGGFHDIRATSITSERSGAEVLQVSGHWFRRGFLRKPARRRAMSFFAAMEKTPLYDLRNPTFDGDNLRLSVLGNRKTIRTLRAGLDRLKVPYRVTSLGHPSGSTGTGLENLTSAQINVLRLAHTMGYYSIPRRTNTADLARLLQVDKGTVGEHLRRAEKNVFDRLLER